MYVVLAKGEAQEKKDLILCLLRVHSFGMIQIRISDLRSLGSCYIKGTDESTLDKDPSVLLMHYDLSDLGSLILIWIVPKEHTPRINAVFSLAQRKQTCSFFVLIFFFSYIQY